MLLKCFYACFAEHTNNALLCQNKNCSHWIQLSKLAFHECVGSGAKEGGYGAISGNPDRHVSPYMMLCELAIP